MICCQHDGDAQRILKALGKRLERYHLQLNEEKTRLVPFSKRAYRRDRKPAAFDFLSFTFYWGRSQKGAVIPKKRLRVKLKRVNEWARGIRNRYRLSHIWKLFCAKLRGNIQYYGVFFNSVAVWKFVWEAVRILFKWLNRRSFDCSPARKAGNARRDAWAQPLEMLGRAFRQTLPQRSRRSLRNIAWSPARSRYMYAPVASFLSALSRPSHCTVYAPGSRRP